LIDQSEEEILQINKIIFTNLAEVFLITVHAYTCTEANMCHMTNFSSMFLKIQELSREMRCGKR